jgi:hypothetical protein
MGEMPMHIEQYEKKAALGLVFCRICVFYGVKKQMKLPLRFTAENLR